jgi:hypothetical protein
MEPPDPQEKRIRFGCGFVFGLLAGALVAIRIVLENEYYFLAVCLFFAIVCALLALNRGDRFWLGLKDRRWWRDPNS